MKQEVEVPLVIKQYSNLENAMIDTETYGRELSELEKESKAISDSLHSTGVFVGPISDDCHENGYIRLIGYMYSLHQDIDYVYDWLKTYRNAFDVLENDTERSKADVFDKYSSGLSIYSK